MSSHNSARKLLAAICFVALALAVIGWNREPRQAPLHADRILVEKNAHRLTLLWKGQVMKTYSVALGGSPVGPKRCEGDKKTPEGIYRIDSRLPQSSFHRALHISYPSPADRAQAQRLGCQPGGAIMIHGLGTKFRWVGRLHTVSDWTSGCIAVTNQEIEEIWRAIPDGTVVEIRP